MKLLQQSKLGASAQFYDLGFESSLWSFNTTPEANTYALNFALRLYSSSSRVSWQSFTLQQTPFVYADALFVALVRNFIIKNTRA